MIPETPSCNQALTDATKTICLINILQQIQVVSSPPVSYSLFQGALESVRACARFETEGRVNAVRQPDMNLSINVVPVKSGWTYKRTEREE